MANKICAVKNIYCIICTACINDNIEDPIFILEMYILNCTYKINYFYI